MADGPAEVLKSAQSWLIISSLMLGGKGGFFWGGSENIEVWGPYSPKGRVLFLGVTP